MHLLTSTYIELLTTLTTDCAGVSSSASTYPTTALSTGTYVSAGNSTVTGKTTGIYPNSTITYATSAPTTTPTTTLTAPTTTAPAPTQTPNVAGRSEFGMTALAIALAALLAL